VNFTSPLREITYHMGQRIRRFLNDMRHINSRFTCSLTYTPCYLPPGRGDFPAFTPAEAGTRFSDPEGMEGWVDLDGATFDAAISNLLQPLFSDWILLRTATNLFLAMRLLQWFLTFFTAGTPERDQCRLGSPSQNWKSMRSGIK